MQLIIESNSAVIAQALSRAAQDITDTTPMMAAIGQRLETNIRDRFDSKTDPSGKAWEPYKAISAAIYERIHKKPPPGTLMDRSGNLRAGVEHHASEDEVEVGMTATVTNLSGKVWSLGAIHEFGTDGLGKKGGGAIPRRGMVFGGVAGQGSTASVTQVLSDSDHEDVVEIIQAHIQRAMGGLG